MMGKRKSTEEEIDATCQSIAKKIATLSDMIMDGRLSEALTADITALTHPVVEQKRHRGAKPVKDPRAPTRNLTSYIHYTNDNRKKIVDAHPGMAPRDVARTLGEGWRGLSAKEKARYDQLAKDDLKRYNDEMKVYKESNEAGSNGDEDDDDEEDDDKSNSDADSDDEEDELMSDPPPKVKQQPKRSTSVPKEKTKTKSTAKNVDDDDASDPSSDSDSDSDSSSSEESSSSSDSSDSDGN